MKVVHLVTAFIRFSRLTGDPLRADGRDRPCVVLARSCRETEPALGRPPDAPKHAPQRATFGSCGLVNLWSRFCAGDEGRPIALVADADKAVYREAHAEELVVCKASARLTVRTLSHDVCPVLSCWALESIQALGGDACAL